MACRVATPSKGPKELTATVDMSRDESRRVHARLLDLVPGRSKKAYTDRLTARGLKFRRGVRVTALDPYGGCTSAIDDQLDDATTVLDAFRVVELRSQVVEGAPRSSRTPPGAAAARATRCSGIRTILRGGAENLTAKQRERLVARSTPTTATRRCSSPASAPRTCAPPPGPGDMAEGRALAENRTSRPCAVGGRRSWPTSPPAERTTAIPRPSNGIIELHCRLARGYLNRDSYWLRMLLPGGGRTP
ncbi:transposase [Isoptericola jiangsuensis]|uniref:transposase n=1 Tax=Isoptericola jiangsuensis TaxID=548579 RepID=UPI000BF79678|nr:transposase [Isoptericola jiangsuensis]